MTDGPRTVLVTGARGVLGSAVAAHFREADCRVIGVARSMPKDALSKDGGIEWIGAELSQADEVRGAIAVLGQPADILVHCAGGFRFAMTDDISDDDVDFLIAANLQSALQMVRAVLPGMKASGYGRIVLVSSLGTLHPTAGMSVYLATKAGLNAFVKAVADEVKDIDVTINAVLPSIIDTPANRKDMPDADPSKWVSPGDLATIISGLIANSAINGALLPVAGRL